MNLDFLSPEAMAGYVAGIVSSFLSSQIVKRVKKYIISKIIFNSKNRKWIAEEIDEAMDKFQKKYPDTAKPIRDDIRLTCRDIDAALGAKDGVN